MELPFAVDSTNQSLPHRVVYQDDIDDDGGGGDGTSSLVTASSRSSTMMETSQTSYEPIRAGHIHPSRGGGGYPYANTQNPSSFVSVPSPHPSTEVPRHVHAAHQHLAPQHEQLHGVPPFSNFDGLDSVLSQFGVAPPPAHSITSQQAYSHPPGAADRIPAKPTHQNPELLNDFTYVTVCETDDEDEIGFVLEAAEKDAAGLSSYGADAERDGRSARDSILGMLVRHATSLGSAGDEFPSILERANQEAQSASLAKKEGDLAQAIHCHTNAAKLYRDAATCVRDDCLSMRNSLLVLSQTQAKTALALQRIARVRPDVLLLPTSTKSPPGQKPSSHQELLLRAKVRGALSTKTEEDISDSTFLGKATTNYKTDATPTSPATPVSQRNPVDEMMELERELRNMDMAIDVGSSIASLETRTQQRMKSSIFEGSFMVVPPGSNSYMSSSVANPPPVVHGTHSARQAVPTNIGVTGTANVRARANRVQSLREVTGKPTTAPQSSTSTSHQAGGTSNRPLANTSLDSSWWGNSSQASQVLTSSVISLANGIGTDHGALLGGGSGPTSTKQVLMHLDRFKVLSDENDALQKELTRAKAAEREIKASREEMIRFREEFSKRFAVLKEALDKFRNEGTSSQNPVATSDYARSTSAASEQLARQEQLIKKLTADLKKEKEESKKKDSALLKYESFYREVKARSAAKQRQKEAQQQTQQQSQRHAVQLRQPAKPFSR